MADVLEGLVGSSGDTLRDDLSVRTISQVAPVRKAEKPENYILTRDLVIVRWLDWKP